MKYLLFLILPLTLFSAPTFTAVKSTDQGIDIVRLTDAAHQVEVSIVPSLGNRAYEMKVHGKNILYFPMTLAAFKEANGRAFNGIPFLAPWGNRISGGGFWANGKHYLFNESLKNLNSHNGIAMHGMLTASQLWEVTDVNADKKSAHVTSRLQFWKYPDLMANWPFAHEYLMTYSLTAEGLEVKIAVRNLSADPMPIAIGFHPYFNIPDVPRSEWSAHIPASKHVEMDSSLVATGEMTDNHLPDQITLNDHTFDDGFTDINGDRTFSIQSGNKKIEVAYGPKYKVALVYSPPKQNFVCFEPMAGITNSLNLAHEGKYSELQSVAPGEVWQESFYIRTAGL